MPKLDINGTPVEFPFKPYDCQLTYLRGVLEALNGSVRTLSSDRRFFNVFLFFQIFLRTYVRIRGQCTMHFERPASADNRRPPCLRDG